MKLSKQKQKECTQNQNRRLRNQLSFILHLRRRLMDEKVLIEILNSFTESAERVDRVNKRFFAALVIGIITLCFTICFIVGAYFFSSYQYPAVEQSAEQDGQRLEQSIK